MSVFTLAVTYQSQLLCLVNLATCNAFLEVLFLQLVNASVLPTPGAEFWDLPAQSSVHNNKNDATNYDEAMVRKLTLTPKTTHIDRHCA